MSEKKIKIGVSIGDVNGIGLEIIIKTFADTRMTDFCTPIVYGNTKIASYYRKNMGLNDFSFNVITDADQASDKKPNMINCWDEDVKITPGEANETGGKYAFLSLEAAVNDLLEGKIDALVTAPINKKTIQSDEFNFPGWIGALFIGGALFVFWWFFMACSRTLLYFCWLEKQR